MFELPTEKSSARAASKSSRLAAHECDCHAAPKARRPNPEKLEPLAAGPSVRLADLTRVPVHRSEPNAGMSAQAATAAAATAGTQCRPMALQPKLMVGAVNDPLEREADSVADRVMRMTDPQVSLSSGHAVSRKCAACEREEEKPQRKATGTHGAVTDAPASLHEVLASPGRPLDETTRAFFEPRFGQDFRHVRVHSDARAAESARGISSYAYTVGHNMVFDAGRFAPATTDGRRLIAHELAHVVQQSGCAPTVQRQPAPTADPTAEPPANPIPLEEQLDAQLDAEKALRLKWSRRRDKEYAWSQGRKDSARIRKNWKLSPKLQQEITTKVRFFEGEAKGAYLLIIGPALQDVGSAEQTIEILAPPPSEEQECPVDQTILVYQGKPGQGRCITESDTEFRQNYIDNNIVQADPMAIPNTTWGNLDHERVPQMQFTYKDGRTLVVNVKDIPAGDSFRDSGTTPRIFLARYEKRSDGFIYPIRGGGASYYVSYRDAPNIMSLRAGLHESIEALKLNLQIMEATVSFAGNIAALGGFASLNRPGGLFERVPRRQSRTQPSKPPVPSGRGKTDPKKPLKPVAVAESEETQSTVVSRTDEDSTGFKGEKKSTAKKAGKEQTEEVSPQVGGKKQEDTEDPKGGKMKQNPLAGAEPSLSGSAVDHVFDGDAFGGYHSIARGPNPNVRIGKVRSGRGPDANGVYRVKVEILDPVTKQVIKAKESTMFPDSWSEGRVLSETYAAMRSSPQTQGAVNSKGVYVTRQISPSGVMIQIDYMNGKPVSFYPIHAKDIR